MVVNGDSEVTDLAIFLQFCDGILPFCLVAPLVAPDMELLDVDRLQCEVPEGAFSRSDDVVVWERIPERGSRAGGPPLVFRGDLACHRYPLLPLLHEPPYQHLAVSVAVDQGRVDEVQAEVNRSMEGL